MGTITVSLIGESTKVLDDNNIITISQQVQILDDIIVIGDKVITIQVPKFTDGVLNFAVQKMKAEILDFKRLQTLNRNINTTFANFTSLVQAGV
ncbi:MAG: hypothetical protein PHW28_11525 [Mesotoga sp.]|nr:hypothetical protein [Mesotoga sp.]